MRQLILVQHRHRVPQAHHWPQAAAEQVEQPTTQELDQLVVQVDCQVAAVVEVVEVPLWAVQEAPGAPDV